MQEVLNYRCYNYKKSLYLIDMTFAIDSDKIDWFGMNVPEEGVPTLYWQTPYLEQFFTLDETKLYEPYEDPSPALNPSRVLFFVYKSAGKTLHTPYGDFPLTDTEDAPKQLKKIVKFEEES